MDTVKMVQCLLLMPHGEQFTEVRRVIVEVLRANDIESIDPTTGLMPGSAFASTIQDAIERADFLIADVTGFNPNVMYEIGLAHGRNKPVLPIVQKTVVRLPADLAGTQYLVYTPTDLADLEFHLRRWIGGYVRVTKREVS